MGVETFAPEDMFTVRIFSRLKSNLALPWSNTFEFRAHADGDVVDLDALADVCAAFIAGLSYNLVEVFRYTISTWVPDSHPYDPFAFKDGIPTVTDGQRIPGINQLLGYQGVWAIDKEAYYGRLGKLYLRCAITEADVNGTGGTLTWTDATTMRNLLIDTLDGSGMNDYIYSTAGATGKLWWSLIGLPKGVATPQHRNIKAVTLGKPALVKMDHRWYNRAEPPGQPA